MTLPLPKLVTFYSGKEDIPDKILKLSDSFPKEADPNQADVEVKVHMYNVSLHHQSHLLKECKTLAEYSWFIDEVRKNQETAKMDLMSAVDKAIEDMPDDFIIKRFLKENQTEVKNMCLTEYNEAETMELFKEEGREEGREEGVEQTLIRQICRKLKKGKELDQIADELEEKEENIKPLFELALKFAPDYDEDKVIKAMQAKEVK